MDPLSITAGVVGIVEFSGKVIAACSTYISALNDAPNDLFLIRAEVASLQAIVRTLDLPRGPGLPGVGNTEATQALRAPGGTLARCQKSLKRLLDLLVASTDRAKTAKPAAKSFRPSNFTAFRLASLLTPKRSKQQTQTLYDELAWTAFDLASWPSKKKKAKSLLDEIVQHKTTISLALAVESGQSLGSVLEQLNQLSLSQTQIHTMTGRNNKAEVCRWLTAPDFSTKHSAVIAARSPGTCSWVFDHEAYTTWSTHGGILWMNGIAGYGKSTLVSSIVQQLQLFLPTQEKLLVYFYFDRDEEEMTNISGFLRAVVIQLLQKLDMSRLDFVCWFREEGVAAFESHQKATPNVLENAVLTIALTKKIVVVLDGLDECDDTKLLMALIGRLKTRSIDIMISSRPSASITEAWNQLTQEHPGTCHELALSPSLNEGDIAAYVTQTVDKMISSKTLRLRDLDLKAVIINTLKAQSGGMFQWVASHLRHLSTYCTDHDISEAMREIPQGLDKTYDAMIRQLVSSTPPRNLRLCRRIFQMLLFAQRPLSLPELSVAISIKPESTQLDRSAILTNPRSILALGGPLVVYSPETNLVQFAHHTIREYLLSLGQESDTFHFVKEREQLEIAQTCLTYIQCLPVIEQLESMTYADLHAGGSEDGDLAFVRYAAKSWIAHAQKASMAEKSKLTNLLYRFFFAQEWIFSIWRAAAEPPWHEWERRRQSTKLNEGEPRRDVRSVPVRNYTHSCKERLYSRFGAGSDPVAGKSKRLHQPADAFMSGGRGEKRGNASPYNAFHYLARINHPDCLLRFLRDASDERLVPSGTAHVIAGCGPLNTTALHEAVKHGAFEFLEVCFSAPWNIEDDVVDLLDRTPLFYACQLGNLRAVQLLLRRGVTATKTDWYGSTPLHEAVRNSHLDVVKCLLLVPHIAVSAADTSGDTPISIACRMNDSEMVTALAGRSSGRAILDAVPFCLLADVTPDLRKALVESCAKIPWTPGDAPLQQLVIHGFKSSLSTLSRNKYSVEETLPILRIFLNNGYPVDLRDTNMATALATAISYGNDVAVEQLLGWGAELSLALPSNASSQELLTIFLDSVDKGGFKTALLLLERGVQWESEKDWDSRFMHSWAARVCESGGSSSIDLLNGVLRAGMNINTTDAKGQSLLHLLCLGLARQGHGSKELCWILKHGGDPSARDAESMMPLHRLCENQKFRWEDELGEILSLLTGPLVVRECINKCIPPHGAPIHILVRAYDLPHRIQNGLPRVVRHALPHLIEAGASVTARNEYGETALDIALAALARHPMPRGEVEDLLKATNGLVSSDRTANTLSGGPWIIEKLLESPGSRYDWFVSLLGRLHLSPSQAATVLGRVLDTKALNSLIKSGFDVKSCDELGNTPLHLQARMGSGDLRARMELLLQAGADPNALNSAGMSVMESLRLHNPRSSGARELLLWYGADR